MAALRDWRVRASDVGSGFARIPDASVRSIRLGIAARTRTRSTYGESLEESSYFRVVVAIR